MAGLLAEVEAALLELLEKAEVAEVPAVTTIAAEVAEEAATAEVAEAQVAPPATAEGVEAEADTKTMAPLSSAIQTPLSRSPSEQEAPAAPPEAHLPSAAMCQQVAAQMEEKA